MRTLLLTVLALVHCSLFAAGLSHPYFYRIEYDDKVSWILGTMHTNQSQLRDFPSIRRALANSKLLLTEATDHTEQEFDNLLAPYFDSSLPPLRKKLAPGAWTRLKNFSTKCGRSFENYNQSSSGLVLYLLSGYKETLEENENFAHLDNVFDDQILAEAQQLGVRVDILDPLGFGVDLYSESVTLKALNEYIMQYLAKDGSFTARAHPPEVKSSDRAEKYRSGTLNPNSLEAGDPYLTGEAATVVNGLNFKILHRHTSWLPRILEAIKNGNVFIAVGAGHLIANDDGLLQTLTETPGLKLYRVESTCDEELRR
jgi:uncharacterized protein YbaP (TraB family)